MAATVKIKGYSDTTTSILIPQVVKPEVTLHFRPHSSYAGEYGFDWMRLGDTCLDGDIDYKNYVGRYGYQETGSDPEDVFTAKLKNYETLENEYYATNLNKRVDSCGEPIMYYTPSLNIYREPNEGEAPNIVLELLTEVDIVPTDLYIEFSKKHFEMVGSEDSPNDVNLRQYKLPDNMKVVTGTGVTNKTEIQFKCIHTLSEDETINVWAIKTKLDGTPSSPILSGKLIVKANNQANRRVAKIVFVNVLTNLNEACDMGNDGIIESDVVEQKKNLEPFFKQALIRPDVAKTDLPLYDYSDDDIMKLWEDYIVFNNKESLFSTDNKNEGDKGLIDYLEERFNKDILNAKYANYYKVFFLEGKGVSTNEDGTFEPIGGESKGPNTKSCVIFSNSNPFYVTHELMHCMGLEHSFSNRGLWTFKIGQTDNIMDYSHLEEYAGKKTLKQVSTWRWQWDILRASNQNEF